MKIRLSLAWIDRRLQLPDFRQRSRLPLTARQRQLVWVPSFVTTFGSAWPASQLRDATDFVTLEANPENETLVRLQESI
jgi:hypothetical protein